MAITGVSYVEVAEGGGSAAAQPSQLAPNAGQASPLARLTVRADILVERAARGHAKVRPLRKVARIVPIVVRRSPRVGLHASEAEHVCRLERADDGHCVEGRSGVSESV